VLRGFLVLDERDAIRRLDRPEAERAVRTRSRQHHADRPVALLLRERAEEVVDRPVLDLVAEREREEAAGDRHVGIRGDHVDVIGLRAQPVGDLDDGHRRGSGQHFGQLALVRGIQVLDQHEDHAGVGGKFSQELGEGFEAAGGRADADDREGPRCLSGTAGRAVGRAVGRALRH
jgi:hypothetical protein